MNANDSINIELDFSKLDNILDLLHQYQLYPGFELMGNPSNMFNNFNNKTQLTWWKYLISNMTNRYINRYGIENIKKWRFETWNEPDSKMYNTVNFTVESFLSYFWASAEGLHENQLKIGAPAGLFRLPEAHHPLCWSLLNSINNLDNYKNMIEFISFHAKGDGTTHLIINKTKDLIENHFLKKYTKLKNIPIANDEADPLTGWWKSANWRGDTRYAAMISKIIIDHFNKFVTNTSYFPISFISNDNAFLSTTPYHFTQRTLLARFQYHNSTQFIFKPAYITFALLSLLGNRVIPLNITPKDPKLLTIASGVWGKKFGLKSCSILIVGNTETELSNVTFNLSLLLPMQNLSESRKDFRYSIFSLDNIVSNPMKIWETFNKTPHPNRKIRKLMRSVENAQRLVKSLRYPETGKLNLNVLIPSLTLIEICSNMGYNPRKVFGLHYIRLNKNEVLFLWRANIHSNKCLLRYEVEWRNDSSESFRRINQNENSILQSYHFDASGKIKGECRVRAVDLWFRNGPFSETLVIMP